MALKMQCCMLQQRNNIGVHMLLHERIYHDIFKLIADGNYKRGDLLPSEKRLMEQYHCSLAPVRQAMGQLEQLGLVERRRGKGTFVRASGASDFRLDLVGFTGALYDERDKWVYKTRCIELIKANEELAEKLAVVPGAEVIYVEREGWFKDVPIQLSKHYLPDTDFYDEIKEAGDIQFWRFLLEGKLGLHMVDAVDEVHADLAIQELDGIFPPYKGYPMPLMVVERTSRDRTGRVQDYTVFYIANFKAGGKTVSHRYTINESQIYK